MQKPDHANIGPRQTDNGMFRILVFIVALFTKSVCADSARAEASEDVDHRQDEIAFEDVSLQAGIDYVGNSWSIAWGDVDRDGYQDIFVSQHGTAWGNYPALYLNQKDGTFKNLAREIFPYVWRDYHGAAWADFDNDGTDELLILSGGNKGQAPELDEVLNQMKNVLWRLEDSQFVNRASEMDIEDTFGRGRSPFVWDADRDGQLDLVLLKGAAAGPQTFFYRQSESKFVPCTTSRSVVDRSANKTSLRAIAAARLFDSDQLILIGSSEDRSVRFFEPDGKCGAFERGAVNIKPQRVMEIILADLTGDLRQEAILVGRSLRIFQIRDGTFSEVSVEMGLPKGANCKTVAVADFDNDMDMDILCGRTKSRKNIESRLFENSGREVFHEVLSDFGARQPPAGILDQLSAGDFDNDGAIDLFVTNGDRVGENTSGPHKLYRNRGGKNNWIGFELEGTVSPKSAYGARTFLIGGGRTQVRDFTGGFKGFSQNDRRVHFGLGMNRDVESLIVQWPGGAIEQFGELETNTYQKILEGSGEALVQGLILSSVTDSAGKNIVTLLALLPDDVASTDVEWDLGDGNSIAGSRVVSHPYNNPGTYDIRARIDSGDGARHELRRQLAIAN